jgi:glycine/D-amino acid oxidase-like deaminating enzyme
VSQSLWIGQPLWLPERTIRQFPKLTGRHKTTVAIVGGGITAALTAYRFASAGIEAVVLEAGAVASGSTAASSALILQEPDLELAQLADRYGLRPSRRIWQLGQQSVRSFTSLLRKLQIRCDLARRSAIYYAADADAVERLRHEFTLRSRSGFAADWLGVRELRNATGISGRGAIRTRGNAQLDPYRACVGLLRSAVSAGARVFEGSPVRRIDVQKDGVRITTPNGRMDAQGVVIATGYATPYFRPLAGRFRMYRTYVLATGPISALQRAELGLDDAMVWDARRPYHYARWTKDRRLLLGGGDQLVRPGQKRQRQLERARMELRQHFEGVFPALADIPLEFAWEGLFAMTPDSLPYIGTHPRYPRHLFALGYGGNGMSFSQLASRFLLEQWQGVKSRDHALFAFDRSQRS